MVEMAVKRRLILIVAEGCPCCRQDKRAVENSGAKIEVLDATKSEETAKICKRALKTFLRILLTFRQRARYLLNKLKTFAI